jgi:putative membrane protein
MKVSELLSDWYPWVKAFHIMAVIAWMAGLFYLPRLFVYHAERVTAAGELHDTLMVMEDRLQKVIMRPAMVAVWVAGLALVATPGIVDWSEVWPWTKAAGVLAMTWFHHWLIARRKDFAAGRNRMTGRQYRMMNEVPTLLMALIVLSVVVKF